MIKTIQAYKLKNWRRTPLGSHVLLCIEANETFLNDGDVINANPVRTNRKAIEESSFTIERTCMVVIDGGGVSDPVLQLPPTQIHTTDDSSNPAASYSVHLIDPKTRVILYTWFSRLIVPANMEQPTWDQLYSVSKESSP